MATDLKTTRPASDAPRRFSRCPACRRSFVWRENPHRPFCSVTCRLIDLGVWLDEGYRIPGGETPTDPELGGRDPRGGG